MLSESGHLHCWGVNASFGVGVRGGETCGAEPQTLCVRDPVLVPGIDSVSKVAAGSGATCAVRTDGSVWCWGSNLAGILGPGIDEVCDAPGAPTRDGKPQTCSPDPIRIEGITGATDIDSWGGMCVSTEDGAAYEWGWYGRTSPRLVAGVKDAVAVEDGCALQADGSVVCWPYDTLAAEPIDWDGEATSLALGYQMGCVIDEPGKLYCWNLGTDWESLTGPDPSLDCLYGISCRYRPEEFELEQPVAEASGSYEVMWIRTSDGGGRAIVLGELHEPLELPAPAIQLSAGFNGACAVLEDRSVYCWANPGTSNEYLELGPEPARVELCRQRVE